MKIESVFEIVKRERQYQDSLGSDRVDGHVHSVGEELLLMNTYLRKATDAWSNNPGDFEALMQIRKIAAIAVRSMENHLRENDKNS